MKNKLMSEVKDKNIDETNRIMKRHKKLQFFILAVVCVLVVGTPLVVLADNVSRRSKIKSKGKIDFGEGKIVVDSADLIYLADEMDSLETTYKATTVDALNSIGTYFRSDGTITYEAGKNEADTEEEKAALSFANIKNGIVMSQSVASLSGIQAVDKSGNKLFYLNQSSATNKSLLQTTINNTGYPVVYQPITADNLTAGTAAWVNGKLIKGNGKDNESSYVQGFLDGQANAMGNLNISYTYHYHSGDATNGGGCYKQVTSSEVCGNIVWKRNYYKDFTCHYLCVSHYADDYGCDTCGATTGWRCAGGGNSCGNISGQIGGSHIVTKTSWQPACGYSQGQILTATIVY